MNKRIRHIQKSATPLGNPLEDLVAERVDGVSNPATRLDFFLLKSSDEETKELTAEQLRKSYCNLLELLAQDSEFIVSKSTADTLEKIAEALAVTEPTRFKAFGMDKKKKPEDMKKNETVENTASATEAAAPAEETQKEAETTQTAPANTAEAAPAPKPETPAATAQPIAMSATDRDILKQEIVQDLATSIRELLSQATGRELTPSALEKNHGSKQPEGQEITPTKKAVSKDFGKGMFEDTVFSPIRL